MNASLYVWKGSRCSFKASFRAVSVLEFWMPLSRKILVPEQHPLQSWTGAKSRGGVGKGNASWTLKLAICADLTRASCEILKELCCLIVTGRLQPELRQHGLHGRKDHRGPFFVSCLQLAFLNRSTRSWTCLNSSAAAFSPCDYEALRASGRHGVETSRRGPGLRKERFESIPHTFQWFNM